MNRNKSAVSYTLATLAGVCFISGLVILSKYRELTVLNRLVGIMASLDYLLNSKRKRHIMGGILMSASLLFAGLAFTIVTLKPEENNYENEQYIE